RGGVPPEVRQPLRRRRAGLRRRGDPAARHPGPTVGWPGAAGEQARPEPTQETRKHPALKLRCWLLVACGALGVVGCASAPPPVSKIVNGHVIVTRAIGPDAYAHYARAQLYEEDQDWDQE